MIRTSKASHPTDLLIISYLDYPYHAGLSRRISGLSKVLDRCGIKVRVLAPIARSATILDESPPNIVVQHIDLRRFRSRNPEKPMSKFILWILFTLVASIRILKDFIRNPCLLQYQSIYSALPAFIPKLLLGAQVMGDDIVLIHPVVDLLTLRLTDVVVTPSPRTYSLARQLGKHTFYVPNGIERILKTRASSKKRTMLFVGTLSFDQNLRAVENILRIASDLDKKGLTFEVLIVGGPVSYAEYLFRHPMVRKHRVKFTGMISSDKLTEFYSSSFIGLLPFFRDTPLTGGQRMKGLEFLANGLLVISGPEGIKGIRGLKPGRHYLLANSLHEMCSIIEKCLSEPEEYRDIAREGARHASSNYSWETLAKDYVKFVRRFTLANVSQ